MVRTLFLVAVFAATQGMTAAYAESDAAVAKKARLLGGWAANCKEPPSPKNPYVVYSVKGGDQVTRTLQMGDPKLDGIYTVKSIRVTAANRVAMTVYDATQSPSHVVADISAGRMFSVSSESGGKWFIKDGRFTSSDSPVPRFEKCSGG